MDLGWWCVEWEFVSPGDWSSHGLFLYRLIGSMRESGALRGLAVSLLMSCLFCVSFQATAVILCCVHHTRDLCFLWKVISIAPSLPEIILGGCLFDPCVSAVR